MKNRSKSQNEKRAENFYTQDSKVPVEVRLLRMYYASVGKLMPGLSTRIFWKLFTTPRPRQIKAKQELVLRGATVKNFEYKNQELNYYEWGSGEKTVLLLHGWEGMAADFGKMIKELTEAGYKVAAVDFPAHGNSEGKRANLPIFMDVIRIVISKYGPVYAIAGHSLGANAAIFSLFENGYLPMPQKLILMGAHPTPFHFFRQFQTLMEMDEKLFIKCVERIEKMLGRDIQNLTAYDTKLNVPEVLMIHDIDDKVAAAEYIHKLADLWPQSELFEGDHGGHFRHYKHPEVIQKVKQFLGNNGSLSSLAPNELALQGS